MNRSLVWNKARLLLQYFLVAAIVTPTALAHEFWIEPSQYKVPAESMIEATLRNGEDFDGSSVAYYKGSTNRFEAISVAGTETITPRAGDDPALSLNAKHSGLHVIVHQKPISTLTYTTWEKFQRFADHKDFKDILARHQARGLSETHFKEAYSRHSKSLIAVGHGVGNDRQSELEIELVALQNPYTDNLDRGIKIAGYYQGKIHPDAQIELFEKAPDGKVQVSLYRTNDQGVVVLPVKPQHRYLVDMVVLRKPSKSLAQGKGVVWETLWASLTFKVE